MATAPTLLSPADYLEQERQASFRNEYVAGQILAMSGASYRHNRINQKISSLLGSRASGCEVVSSDQRVYTPKPSFAYPDTVVCCGGPAFLENEYRDTLINPVLIVEVLSKTTRNFDLGLKFSHYKLIPSFREYLAVEQESIRIFHYESVRQPEWSFAEYTQLTDRIQLLSLGSEVDLPVSDIYAGIEF